MDAASSSSLVSKAKTVFHSAAAKAEKVYTDIKSDLKNNDHPAPSETEEEESHKASNHRPQLHSSSKKTSTSTSTDCENDEFKQPRWKPATIGRKHDWQERLRNLRKGKKEAEDKERALNQERNFNLISDFLDGADANTSPINSLNLPEIKIPERESFVEKEGLNVSNMDTIPPTPIIKQLGTAIESGKRFNSLKDLLASSRSSSPVKERAGLSFSAMKSLVLRDKEDKLTFEICDDEELLHLSQSLFDPEGRNSGRKKSSGSAIASLPREIHGAPPESFVVRLSEIIGNIKTLRQMALFWCRVVTELRRLWTEGQPVPHVPLDESPDLNSCLLHQQLQVINCCISRKKHRAMATESLYSAIRDTDANTEEPIVSPELVSSNSALYARVASGDLVLRLGADHPSENLTMLETGEPVYSPVTQEGPILTEDLIKEAEEFVLRTGSCGAGCSQLLSDMQAFKAANPGCILEDFVRWHSPPDWSRNDPNDEDTDSWCLPDSTSKRGQLSSRMQKEGNLWRELWDTAKPLPAVKQIPLYDEDLAVEGILNFLEEITPFELFRQLFVSILGSGFVIAEAMLPPNSNLSKLFYECKDYIIAACQGGSWSDNIDDLCQVYETVETIIVYPEDCLKIINQPEESAVIDEPKRRFKKFSLNFGGRDRQFLKKPAFFSRKPPKPDNTSPGLDENDWTVV